MKNLKSRNWHKRNLNSTKQFLTDLSVVHIHDIDETKIQLRIENEDKGEMSIILDFEQAQILADDLERKVHQGLNDQWRNQKRLL